MTWLEDLFVPGSIDGWDLLWAAVCVIVAWIISIFAYRAALKVLRKTPNVTDQMALIGARIARYGTILLGIGVGIGFLGASIQPILAIAVIVAVVLGLALRGIADNFAAGVVIQSRHPVKVGDEIAAGDTTGVVTEMNGRSVIVRTWDGRMIHQPNSKLLSEPIVNYSTHGTRRSIVQVRVDRPTSDTNELLALLGSAAKQAEGVDPDGNTFAAVIASAPERLTLEVRYWHHPFDAVVVTSAVIVALDDALRESGFTAVVTSTAGIPPFIPADPL